MTGWLENELADASAYGLVLGLGIGSSQTPGSATGELISLQARLKTLIAVGTKFTDYKQRTNPANPDEHFPFPSGYDQKTCPKPKPNTVTLCGKCIGVNQLGNIMYGYYAQMIGIREPARDFGRGKGLTATVAGLMGKVNDDPWTADGSSPSEGAFNAGVALATASGADEMFETALKARRPGLLEIMGAGAKTKNFNICDVINKNGSGMFSEFDGFAPSTTPYTGPNTNPFTHKGSDKIDAGGNQIK